jgi:hypothetical protein
MRRQFIRRYHLVLASVYLYNEYRGYRELERLLAAIKAKFPDETQFIADVTKHTEDEYKHYLMFRHYFESRNEQPIVIGSSNGYIDRFVKLIFRQKLDELDPKEILNNDKRFFRLCRLVMMTEFRGMKQVDSLLRSSVIQQRDELMRIFRIIERDEPTHCFPYQRWLQTKGSHEPGLRERLADWWIHYSLVGIKFPMLYINIFRQTVTV